MATRRTLEDQIVHYCHTLHGRGWVANHDGNVTTRLPGERAGQRFLATPTAESKGVIARSWLIVVDERGKVVGGSRKGFSEMALHLFVYRQRPDVNAIIHAHPPTATGFAVAGTAVLTTMMAEPVVSLGDEVPLVPYARPKTPEYTTNLGQHVQDSDVVLLQNHGVLAYGPDLETAYLRLELVEHLAKIQLVAQQVGGARTIPNDDVAELLKSRTKAGLGRAAREKEAAATIVQQEVAQAVRRSR